MEQKRNGGRVGVNRRTFVKSAVASSLAGSGVAAGVTAAGESSFVLEQDGTEIPITPLSYDGQTIEEFYGFKDHGHNHSNTKTGLAQKDTSQLFLWDGPQGLSLVAIHDSPHNGTNGEVTFEFSGLPDSGSWVVRDDDTGKTPTTVTRGSIGSGTARTPTAGRIGGSTPAPAFRSRTTSASSPATGVSVTATSEAAFEFTASSPTSDSVSARGAETYGFEVTAEEAGEHAVSVEVTADDAGTASKQATVRVRGKVALVESAADSLGELLDVLRAERPLRKGRNDALVSKLENAASRLDDAVEFAEQGKRKQADNVLNAATKTLGAALNQLAAIRNGDGSGKNNSDGGKGSSGNGKDDSSSGKDSSGKGNSGNGASGSGASADVIRSIERQIDGVVEELTRAKRAEI
jgi:exonuclease VII small subunit